MVYNMIRFDIQLVLLNQQFSCFQFPQIFGARILEETWGMSYIVVSEYHPTGSLRYVLQSNIISWQTMCTMGKSIAEALAYLHGEEGTPQYFVFSFFTPVFIF